MSESPECCGQPMQLRYVCGQCGSIDCPSLDAIVKDATFVDVREIYARLHRADPAHRADPQPADPAPPAKCSACGGEGEVLIPGVSGVVVRREPCPVCHGSGKAAADAAGGGMGELICAVHRQVFPASEGCPCCNSVALNAHCADLADRAALAERERDKLQKQIRYLIDDEFPAMDQRVEWAEQAQKVAEQQRDAAIADGQVAELARCTAEESTLEAVKLLTDLCDMYIFTHNDDGTRNGIDEAHIIYSYNEAREYLAKVQP